MKIIGTLAVASAIALAAFGVAEARGGGHGGSHSSSSHSSTKGTGDHYVHGYTKKDGTVVQGYHATNPNGTRNDNYSTRGNVNPYTGEAGTKPRDGESPN
jgi:hypothetical protein